MARIRIRALGALATPCGAALGGTALRPRSAHAQSDRPSKPVRLVVPFVAGGSCDIVARSMQPRMQQALGPTVVVDNRPGADGAIAAAEVARAPADGHTFMVGSIGVFAIDAALYPRLPDDAMKDLEPPTLAVVTPNVPVAGGEFPADDVKAPVACARKNPGRLSCASSGTGSSDHRSAELFKLQTDTFGVHIPYRGGAAAMADLIGGNVDVSFRNLGAAMGRVRAGRLKALGVTREKRHPGCPRCPRSSSTGHRASSSPRGRRS